MPWNALYQIWTDLWKGRQQRAVQAQVEHRADFSVVDLGKNTLIIQLQDWIKHLEAKVDASDKRSEDCEKRYTALVQEVRGLKNWNHSQETRIQGLEDSREAGQPQ